MPRKRRLALTMGDPAGIGPEVILKAVARPSVARAAEFLLVGSVKVWEETRERLGLSLRWRSAKAPAFGAPLTVWQPKGGAAGTVRPGRWTARTGAASFRAVEAAVRLCLEDAADGMVTGPICKAAWHAAGFDHPGHTEYLAGATGAERVVMMLAGQGLRVALATTHMALAAVPPRIKKSDLMAMAKILDADLKRYFGFANPRLAVLGLNPHAGEGGAFGREEIDEIAPAVAALRAEGMAAIGPVPADTAFHAALRGDYDAVLAMYHDQGLGPLKTVAFDSGVNVTLGLPVVRVSVDHGAAFDRAGKGTASERSCVEAIRLAARMARCRAKNSLA